MSHVQPGEKAGFIPGVCHHRSAAARRLVACSFSCCFWCSVPCYHAETQSIPFVHFRVWSKSLYIGMFHLRSYWMDFSTFFCKGVCTKIVSWFNLLTVSLLTSYIYGAPCIARNFNVVYIWTYVWQRWKPTLSICCTVFQHWINAESYPVAHLCVNNLLATKVALITDGI
jgi:hypothetical protein